MDSKPDKNSISQPEKITTERIQTLYNSLRKLVPAEYRKTDSEIYARGITDAVCELVAKACVVKLNLQIDDLELQSQILRAASVLLHVISGIKQNVGPEERTVRDIIGASSSYIKAAYTDKGEEEQQAPDTKALHMAGISMTDTIPGRIQGFLSSNRIPS